MNDKKEKKARVKAGRKRVRMRILTSLVIYTLVLVLIFLGYYRWFPTRLSNQLASVFGLRVTYFLREYKHFFIIGFYIIGVIIICVQTATRYVRYVDAISLSLTSLVDDDAEMQSLPAELKDIEIALRDVKYTLVKNENAAKMAEKQKNDLLVFLAHDLKTPLTSVIGYLSLMNENPDMPEEQKAKYLGITLEKAYRLEELLSEFFDITRMNVQSMVISHVKVDLTMMLYQIADEFYPVLAENRLTAVLDVESGLKVSGDADKLARVFDNLLRNAAAYSYPNTCVCIEAAREADGIYVRIKNQGDEVPPEKLALIFEKFYRVDSSRGTGTGGAGLGLAIAKEIVELHGGRISVSSVGHEMQFMISLPECQEGNTEELAKKEKNPEKHRFLGRRKKTPQSPEEDSEESLEGARGVPLEDGVEERKKE